MKQIVHDNIWADRLKSADRYYKQWEQLFKCKILEEYYEGLQWKSQRELGYDPYVINKFYETIQIKIAEYVATFPKYVVSAKPISYSQDFGAAADSAQLKEDILNTVIQDPRLNYSYEMECAYKDAYFRFGMLEIGYAADWIQNPNAPKPLLKGQTEQHLSNKERRKMVEEPKELPMNERVYIKHVSAKRFRVGGVDHKYLNRCSWVGYYEFVNKDDLLAMPKLMNRDKLETVICLDPDPDVETNDRETNYHRGNVIKLWFLWDLRAMQHLMVVDTPALTVYQKNFKRLPLMDLRFDQRVRTEGFYPIPPCYNWLSPQNEINEIREMLRAHRRRFVRKFQVQEGQIDDVELEKFETGPDGALIKIRAGSSGIVPIENADLGQAVAEATATSADDFTRITATTNQDVGVSDRGTATESKIIAEKSNIRGNKDRDRVVRWLAGVGREILLTIRDKFTLGIWTELGSPEGEHFAGIVQDQAPTYKWVSSEELNDGYDFRIDVDVTSISTTAAADEKQNYLQFLSVLTQFPMIAFSPTLVRETAYRMGYRNTKVIKEMQQMALLMQQGRMKELEAQVAPAATPPDGNAPQQLMQQMTPPDASTITNQLKNQLVQ